MASPLIVSGDMYIGVPVRACVLRPEWRIEFKVAVPELLLLLLPLFVAVTGQRATAAVLHEYVDPVSVDLDSKELHNVWMRQHLQHRHLALDGRHDRLDALSVLEPDLLHGQRSTSIQIDGGVNRTKRSTTQELSFLPSDRHRREGRR
ncbi:hypothetical protein OGAPHI_004715 [Ogataea philodendri]|uniref:Uncharacterized protein n=1 Tax=Ogataea philodendri TaxID=1378263 RepID=A0A9P8P2U0_9ASCO|nr:uncharacterized protein OGAPHI_004715 [Ogataea philodendri]KAH3664001.1 hypothetical protein OGAPHI_004715 [Ogataea philodendri]